MWIEEQFPQPPRSQSEPTRIVADPLSKVHPPMLTRLSDGRTDAESRASRHVLAFEFMSFPQIAIIAFVDIAWSLLILFVTAFGPYGYIHKTDPFLAKNYTISPHPFHFDLSGLQPFNGFLTLDLTLSSTFETTPSNISVAVQTQLEFSDRTEISNTSLQSDLTFAAGTSNRVRVVAIDRIDFKAFHSNVNLSLPAGKDVPGTFAFSYLNPSYITSNIFIRGIFLILGVLTLVRLLPLRPYARNMAGRALVVLNIAMILATDFFFLLPFYVSASAFRFIDAVLTIFFVCAAAFGSYLQLDAYVSPPPAIAKTGIAIRAIGFVVAFVVWTVLSVISLVEFQKEFVLQKDVAGWSVVLGLAVVDLVAVIARLVKLEGKNTAGNLVMVLLNVTLPLLLIASRICALCKEEMAWNLQLFDFLAAVGVTIFFGLVCAPVVSESNECAADNGKSLSGFTPGY
jgi:hypothetical protein